MWLLANKYYGTSYLQRELVLGVCVWGRGVLVLVDC